jgi:hypothetical protein
LLDDESVGRDGSEDEVGLQGRDEAAQHQHIQPQTLDGRDRIVLGPWLDPVVPALRHGPLPMMVMGGTWLY